MTNEPITDRDLNRILKARDELTELKADLTQRTRALEVAEADIITRLKAGSKLAGKLTAFIKTELGASRPKWKEEFVQHMLATHAVTEPMIMEEMSSKYPRPEHDVLEIGHAPKAKR